MKANTRISQDLFRTNFDAQNGLRWHSTRLICGRLVWYEHLKVQRMQLLCSIVIQHQYIYKCTTQLTLIRNLATQNSLMNTSIN